MSEICESQVMDDEEVEEQLVGQEIEVDGEVDFEDNEEDIGEYEGGESADEELEDDDNDENKQDEELDNDNLEDDNGEDHADGHLNDCDDQAESSDKNDLSEDQLLEDGREWSSFTGLRVKTFSAEELELFKKPFDLGWRREVVLRGTVTSSGKKIGDVYYFSPDKKTKLRSYVEMGLFLKRHPNSGLQPENFTFARQPIYKPPSEIIRHAMQRGTVVSTPNQQTSEGDPFSPSANNSNSNSRSARNSTESAEEANLSLAEGRSKRKRVAPTRFEDEDYSEASPFKKKGATKSVAQNVQHNVGVSTVKSSATNKSATLQQVPGKPMTQSEKRRHLQHQLLQQVHEQRLAKEQLEEGKKPNGVESDKESEKSARKSIMSGTSLIKQNEVKVESDEKQQEKEKQDEKSEEEQPQQVQPGAPCSIMCPGRRGMLPNLMCSRCFCLYHLDCVPGGVFLKEPRVFVCPNCLTPEDTQDPEKSNESKQNGIDHKTPVGGNQLQPQILVSGSPLIIPKPHKSFAPILPKPPQMTQQQQHQVYHPRKSKSAHQSQNTFQSSIKLPAGTHLYRVAQGPHGHSMVVKNQQLPRNSKMDKFSKQKHRRSSMTGKRKPLPFQVYKPPPIAPIAPIKITPAQVQQVLNLCPVKHNRGYREWMYRKRSALERFLAPYSCLNDVLTYLSALDLIHLKKVSRQFNLLASQPHLWKSIKLRGISLIDWQFFGHNIVEANAAEEIDFEGVRVGGDLCEFWRNFGEIIDYLKSVKRLKFGNIPVFVLEEIAAAAIESNLYCSFADLEQLSVKNLFDEEGKSSQKSLAFLKNFSALKGLKSLSIYSKQGFAFEEHSNDCLRNTLGSLKSLESLSLVCLKGFSSHHFDFLSSLTFLKKIEIGSCENWSEFENQSKDQEIKEEDRNGNVESDAEEENEAERKESDDKNGSDRENQKKINRVSAYDYLSALKQLTSLRLVNVAVNTSLSNCLESFTLLESLSFELQLGAAAEEEHFDQLVSVIRQLRKLQVLSVVSSDAATNKRVYHLLRRLDGVKRVEWFVGECVVADTGECLFPMIREEEDEDMEDDDEDDADAEVKLMDMNVMNELLQSELGNTLVEISPK